MNESCTRLTLVQKMQPRGSGDRECRQIRFVQNSSDCSCAVHTNTSKQTTVVNPVNADVITQTVARLQYADNLR
jgi:hypothetical protein